MAVTADDVRVLYTTNQSDATLEIFITQAQLIVTEDLRPNSSLSEDRYDLIAKNLAAHFAYLANNNGEILKSSKMGQSTDTLYHVAGSQGYLVTQYGQTAVSLDTSGILANQSKGRRAEFRVV